ncbi:MAG: orotidine-5'-phosphate decarboxylase [Candidatus Pacebacteria bacterium]|nr:orotidine-5'-phosphate decarboxylase [Candidatus Paceibacterota bacterium]
MPETEPKKRIIVALDVDTIDKALFLVRNLSPKVGLFKIGLQFIHSMLSSVISPESEQEAFFNLRKIRELFELLCGNIFWDGKFKDIPNTIAGASQAVNLIRGGIAMFNVHASGGIQMIKEAVANKGKSKVLAVTVLTSFSAEECHFVYGASPKAKVFEFASYAKTAGADGLICSPQELEALALINEYKGLLKVTPGVRPDWASKGDQKRVMTPYEAVQLGADYVVVGRPITNPPKEIGTPIDAAVKIAEEISAADR